MQTTNQKGIVKLTKAQYNTLITTGSVTDGAGNTFTYQDGYIYCTDEVEYVSFAEPQLLTPEQQAQARANIGAGSGSGGTEVYVNGVLQSTLSFDSDPQTQISAKVPTSRTIAGVDLQDNITKNELLTALNVEDGAEVNEVNDVEIDDVSCVTGTTAEIRTINGDYNASTNRLATESDLSGKLDKVTTTAGDRRLYAINANGTQTTVILDYSNTASAGRVPCRSSTGALMINDSTYTNPGQFNDGLQAINKNKLIERTTALTGNSAPTTSTVGFVGQFYIDAIQQVSYQCVSIDPYIWQPIVQGTTISNPNLLINGDFYINQRALTTYSTVGKYTVDRWKMATSGTTVTKLTKGITLSGTSSNEYNFYQYIENYTQFEGKTATFSLKFANNTDRIRISLVDNIGSTTSDYITDASGVVTVTRTFGTGLTSLMAVVQLETTGASMSVDLLEAKVEFGSVATMFVPRPYAEELALCQRYYFRVNSRGGYGCVASGVVYSTSRIFLTLPLPTTLRTNPTMSTSGAIKVLQNGTVTSFTSAQFDRANENSATIILNGSGFTLNSGALLYFDDDATAYVDFDAEI